MLTIRSRGRLPHWEREGAIYFVTFRLADSLPAHALKTIEFERNDIVATAKRMNRPLAEHERERLAKLFSESIENYLDAGAGDCILARTEVAKVVVRSLFCFHEVQYRIMAWCLMPNHVHVVFKPLETATLAKIVQAWKSVTSRAINRILGRSGTVWQREYYDHLVRNDADLVRVVDYVLENPSKAKLRNWAWVGMEPPNIE